MTRRGFLVAGGLVAAGLGLYAAAPSLHLRDTLRAVVDTLIPEDDLGPSASQVGVVEVIERRIENRPGTRFRIAMVFAWLNMRAGGSFADADTSVREALVGELEAAPDRSWRWYTFRFLREVTMLHYYGDASRALSLGFMGPPQPNGHVAPWQPWSGIDAG